MIFDDGSPVPCNIGYLCRNSPRNAGEEHSKCHNCSLSAAYVENNLWKSFPSFWKPIDGRAKHDLLEERKKDSRKARKEAARERRLAKDKDRQKRAIKATRAEARSNRTIIKATKNSGRSYQDGDHVAAGRISLDTKQQSKRIHPVVNLRELAKIRAQAQKAGMLLGGLILRGKTDVGVVVLHEADFGKLINLLNIKENHEEIPS